jgi:hypothetical protein
MPLPHFFRSNRARRWHPKPPPPPVAACHRLGKSSTSPITFPSPPPSSAPRPLLLRRRNPPELHRRQPPVPPRRKSFSPVSSPPLIFLIPRIWIQRPRLDLIPELVSPNTVAPRRSQLAPRLLVEWPARWEPQEEGVMNIAARFSLS